jgi:hypothetical protein
MRWSAAKNRAQTSRRGGQFGGQKPMIIFGSVLESIGFLTKAIIKEDRGSLSIS